MDENSDLKKVVIDVDEDIKSELRISFKKKLRFYKISRIISKYFFSLILLSINPLKTSEKKIQAFYLTVINYIVKKWVKFWDCFSLAKKRRRIKLILEANAPKKG